LAAAVIFIACGEEVAGVDQPCESDDSCEAGLICDDHGGEKTCQEPHGHTTASSSSVTSGASSASSGGSGGGGGGAGGGGTEPCADYCACIEPACASFGANPFDAPGSCLAACRDYTTEELTCFSAFCVQASEAVAGKEHLCEHAWGAVGTSEC
jgi:hypothetical protein